VIRLRTSMRRKRHGRVPAAGGERGCCLEEGFAGSGRQGGVEEGDEGGGGAEEAQDLWDQGGGQGQGGGELGGEAPLALEDEVGGGICGVEALGTARHFDAVEGFEALGAEGLADLFVVVEEHAADGEELIFFWHVGAGGDCDLLGVELEVEAGAGGFFKALASPPGGYVGLVRQLVGAESDVAVDAHGALGGLAEVVGGEGLEALVDGGDDFQERGLERGFVGRLVGVEPVAVVVTGQRAEELQRCGGEVRLHGGDGTGWGFQVQGVTRNRGIV